MVIDIEAVIQASDIFHDTEAEFFHNSWGISDDDAGELMEIAEGVVYDYIERDDDDWDVNEVVKDLLLRVKFHRLNSVKALFLLLHGYHFLASHVEPTDFFQIDGVHAGNIQIDLN